VKLIVGLGNPGEKYARTRHNVGFVVLDALADLNNLQFFTQGKLKSQIAKNSNLILAKPQTFMNESGKAVSLLFHHYSLSINDLLVVHDDLDISLGEYKVQVGKGPKVHYGINSIEDQLKTDQFMRIRIGVDNRDPENRMPGEAYVLQKFALLEQEKLESVIAQVCEEILQK